MRNRGSSPTLHRPGAMAPWLKRRLPVWPSPWRSVRIIQKLYSHVCSLDVDRMTHNHAHFFFYQKGQFIKCQGPPWAKFNARYRFWQHTIMHTVPGTRQYYQGALNHPRLTCWLLALWVARGVVHLLPFHRRLILVMPSPYPQRLGHFPLPDVLQPCPHQPY